MATLTTASLTRPDTLITIRIKPTSLYGLAWNGKDYGPGETVTLPAYWAARWIGNGRAELIEDESPVTPFGAIDNRDPVESRGRRGR